jgi:prolyl-tRNA synthetase
MNATFLDEKGASASIVMGCYGIGVNRILAAAVESCHDDNGIVWPLAIAPYDVALVILTGKDATKNAEVEQTATALAQSLEAAGVDVLIDDRDLRPGVKFKDVDLIGIPLRVVVGERGLKDGAIELKWRDESAPFTVPLATAADGILAALKARKDADAARRHDRQLTRATERSSNRSAASAR